MLNTKTRLIDKVYSIARSRTFFIVIITLFLIQAVWLAISARSLPYDEYYHMGIIQIYSEQWSPVITEQPYEAGLYGDVTRLHSYFYHYLMSFQYRLISLFTESLPIQTILLRFMNIGFVLGGVLFMRRLLREAGVGHGLINIATLIFTSTPIVVVLAAHVNYDNLILLLTPLLLIYAYRLITRPVTVTNLSWFISIGLISSVIKYLSLAVFTVLTAYILLHFIRQRRQVLAQITSSLKQLAPIVIIIHIGVLILASGLFLERHGQNIVRFGGLNVDCHVVQSRESCNMYSPWRRNEAAARANISPTYGNPAMFFVKEWLPKMVNGPFDVFTNVPRDVPIDQDPYGHYVGGPKVGLQPWLAYLLGGVAVSFILLQLRRLWVSPLNRLFLVSTSFVAVAIFLYNYQTYTSLGHPYAIQPRYFLPLFLPWLILACQALSFSIPKRFTGQKALIAFVVVALYWYGSGVAGWVVRADADWYWQNDRLVSFNQKLQTIGSRIILD